MKNARISFPVYSFRRIETPFDKDPGYRDYVAIVDVAKLPDLTDWRKINVRDPKLSTREGSLTREIKDTFLGERGTFVFYNRGLVVAAQAVEFEKHDEKSGTVTLVLNDPDQHGLLDGGHTYQIIMQNREQFLTDGDNQYVKLEVIVGFGSEELVGLVDARNSSNQVRDESLFNLAQKFTKLKKALASEPYSKKIAYKEYETDDEGEPKPISVREIISLLMTMDIENFSASVHPINSYRSKGACLKRFADDPGSFEKIYPIAKDVLLLWDSIHLRLPDLYNNMRAENGDVSGGRFGKLTGVVTHKTDSVTLDFTGSQSRYSIPAGLKYPILGAFRALLERGKRGYRWGVDPFKMLDRDLGKELARTIGQFALEAQNPSKTGKSPIVWHSCYQSAELKYLRHLRTTTR